MLGPRSRSVGSLCAWSASPGLAGQARPAGAGRPVPSIDPPKPLALSDPRARCRDRAAMDGRGTTRFGPPPPTSCHHRRPGCASGRTRSPRTRSTPHTIPIDSTPARSYHETMPIWRCPHCGTPQREAARCWVCRKSSTSCATCRHFCRGVAAGLGYCGLDRRRAPLHGDEIRACWDPAHPTGGRSLQPTLAGSARAIGTAGLAASAGLAGTTAGAAIGTAGPTLTIAPATAPDELGPAGLWGDPEL